MSTLSSFFPKVGNEIHTSDKGGVLNNYMKNFDIEYVGLAIILVISVLLLPIACFIPESKINRPFN
jgi:hypothetical protein